MDWNAILNWRLLARSHKFPGPDGGTCINEAAVVAAGFEYRTIASADDCPPCFSRAIAAYALHLNDAMPNDLRQELLAPYVVRLAGTADTQEIESKRVSHFALETIRRILPIVLRAARFDDCAAACEGARNLATASDAASSASYAAAAAATASDAASCASYTINAAAKAAKAAAKAANAAAKSGKAAAKAAYAAATAATYTAYAADTAAVAAIYAARAASDATSYAPKAANAAAYAAAKAAATASDAANAAAVAAYATAKASYAASYAATASDAANAAAAAQRQIFTLAVDILNEAICLGKQADPIEIGVVSARMTAARKLAV